jgi:hypothetical protein
MLKHQLSEAGCATREMALLVGMFVLLLGLFGGFFGCGGSFLLSFLCGLSCLCGCFTGRSVCVVDGLACFRGQGG